MCQDAVSVFHGAKGELYRRQVLGTQKAPGMDLDHEVFLVFLFVEQLGVVA